MQFRKKKNRCFGNQEGQYCSDTKQASPCKSIPLTPVLLSEPMGQGKVPRKDGPFQTPGCSSLTLQMQGPAFPRDGWPAVPTSSCVAGLSGDPPCPEVLPGSQESPHWLACHSGNSKDFCSSVPETDFKIQMYSFCITSIN